MRSQVHLKSPVVTIVYQSKQRNEQSLVENWPLVPVGRVHISRKFIRDKPTGTKGGSLVPDLSTGSKGHPLVPVACHARSGTGPLLPVGKSNRE